MAALGAFPPHLRDVLGSPNTQIGKWIREGETIEFLGFAGVDVESDFVWGGLVAVELFGVGIPESFFGLQIPAQLRRFANVHYTRGVEWNSAEPGHVAQDLQFVGTTNLGIYWTPSAYDA